MAKRKPPSPFLRFNSSPEIIRLVVMMYVSTRSRFETWRTCCTSGIDVCHETVRFWWNRCWSAVKSHFGRQLARAPGRFDDLLDQLLGPLHVFDDRAVCVAGIHHAAGGD